jgi:hypothetical protein
MPKPVRARTWRPPLPSARRRRSSTPGCSSWTRNHPQPAAVLPESAARKVSALVWRAHIPGTHAASGPESATWKDQGAQNRPACPEWRLRGACGLSVSTTSWRYGLRHTCRLVTGRSHRPRSTWPNQARLAFLAVTHRYERINCLWLEPFQIDYAPLGECPAHSGQHADRRVRRTLREVCAECSRQPRCHAPSGGQTRGVPETVVVVLGEVGPLEQRVILPGGQGGRPQKH